MKKSAVTKISKASQKKIKNQVVQSSLFGIKNDRYINEPKNLDTKQLQNLKIVHWNVNGLRSIAKKNVLDQYFDNFDIICLSETKIDLQKLKQENVHLNTLWYNKFNQYWSFSTVKKGYSGCVIFTKLRPIKVNYGIEAEKFDQEGRFTVVEYQDFYLVNVYVPNSKRGLLRLDERVKEFDSEFRKYLEKLKQNKMLVVVGDFNVAHKEIDIADPVNNKRSAGFTDEERESFTKLLDTGLVDVWRKTHEDKVQYSWWSNLQKHKTRAEKKGWRIDYCLVNNENEQNIIKTELRDDIMGSDHCPMEIQIQFQQQEKVKEIEMNQTNNNKDNEDKNQDSNQNKQQQDKLKNNNNDNVQDENLKKINQDDNNEKEQQNDENSNKNQNKQQQYFNEYDQLNMQQQDQSQKSYYEFDSSQNFENQTQRNSITFQNFQSQQNNDIQQQQNNRPFSFGNQNEENKTQKSQ